VLERYALVGLGHALLLLRIGGRGRFGFRINAEGRLPVRSAVADDDLLINDRAL
jgi:hypothetical protein